ncbi:EF-hand domain-containing protein [Streptomyces gobiensis]|uniref:EF-hand domain-containing protein n=1 Tax=Streptomyces gobiensis TaxID=2875706 RepID=UPI001E48755C|nr:EF-hand domain-containing protein [Streptomyces gobiensis]UGY94911.1 EF-hand domain-containing protein [Streptomyces gobiensis]
MSPTLLGHPQRYDRESDGMNDTTLRAKYAYRFRIHDSNGDGLVDSRDIVRRAEELLAGLAEPPESARAAAVVRGAQLYWQGVAKLAGIDEDGQLTEAAFVEALVRANVTGTIADVVRPSVEAHIALVDRDGDGVVSLAEFARSQQVLGMTAEAAHDAFAALDREGDGSLTVDEWQQAVMDFYTTTDPAAPGNLVLGLRS